MKRLMSVRLGGIYDIGFGELSRELGIKLV